MSASEPLDRLRELAKAVDPEPAAELATRMLELWTPPGSEKPVAELVHAALLEAGVEDVTLDDEFPDSPTVVARMGNGEGPTLHWHGHLDAIDVPHAEPKREGDVITARGACDMKGAVAAMVQAAGLLKQLGLPRTGSILMTFHGLHENGGSAPLVRLLERGVVGDAAISAELGSGLDLITGSRGLTFWEFEIPGLDGAWHETNAPADAINPLVVGTRLCERLLSLRAELEAGTAEHPGSLFVGKLVAGDYNNRVPASCELAGTRRHHTGSTLEDVADQLRAVAAAVEKETGATIIPHIHSYVDAYDIDPQEPVVRALRRAVEEIGGEPMREITSRASGNGADFVLRAGIPAVYYGCDYRSAHSDNERLSVTELGRLVGVYALMAVYYLESEDT
jgi:acetylornithine deacetylase/succinyl-diaminopimelate desuccinylase-like protein